MIDFIFQQLITLYIRHIIFTYCNYYINVFIYMISIISTLHDYSKAIINEKKRKENKLRLVLLILLCITNKNQLCFHHNIKYILNKE